MTRRRMRSAACGDDYFVYTVDADGRAEPVDAAKICVVMADGREITLDLTSLTPDGRVHLVIPNVTEEHVDEDGSGSRACLLSRPEGVQELWLAI